MHALFNRLNIQRRSTTTVGEQVPTGHNLTLTLTLYPTRKGHPHGFAARGLFSVRKKCGGRWSLGRNRANLLKKSIRRMMSAGPVCWLRRVRRVLQIDRSAVVTADVRAFSRVFIKYLVGAVQPSGCVFLSRSETTHSPPDGVDRYYSCDKHAPPPVIHSLSPQPLPSTTKMRSFTIPQTSYRQSIVSLYNQYHVRIY